jgi:hypothetical protein
MNEDFAKRHTVPRHLARLCEAAEAETMTTPPAIAQALLALILPVHARETMAGELVDEYRENRIPKLGRWRANVWYWRQVGGIWLHSYGWFVVPVVLLIVVHDIFNAFRALSGISYLDGVPPVALVSLSPLVVIGLFVLAGGYGSWRTGRWAGGFVAAFGTFVSVWLFMAVWWNATLYPFAQVQQSNPYWIQAWHWSTQRAHPPSFFGFNPDTPGETFLRWMFWDNVGGLFFLGIALLAVSVVCGGIGSTLGLILPQRRAGIRKY